MLCIVAWVLYVYTKNVAMPDNATLRMLCLYVPNGIML